MFQWLMFLKEWNFVLSISFLVRHLNITAVGLLHQSLLHWSVGDMGNQHGFLNFYATLITNFGPSTYMLELNEQIPCCETIFFSV